MWQVIRADEEALTTALTALRREAADPTIACDRRIPQIH
jgi:hypothetical protein